MATAIQPTNDKVQTLRQKYPRLLGGKLLDASIACYDGWYGLLDKLCADIDQLFRNSGLPDDKYPRAVQVKEKFCGLRFYMGPVDEAIFNQMTTLIRAAEQESFTICAKCGSSIGIKNCVC